MILGIDPGLKCTGWALLSLDRSCLATGSISTDSWRTDDSRIAEIVLGLRGVLKLLEREGRSPTISSVEQYVYQGARSQTCNAFRIPLLVGEIQGFLRLQGLAVIRPTRGQALQAIGLKTNSKDAEAKRAIQSLVKSKGGVRPTNEHTRAAYAAAWWAISSVSRRVF